MRCLDFKVGDKVYFPRVGNELYTIVSNGAAKGRYPILVCDANQTDYNSFTIDGRENLSDTIPSIVLATKKNRKRLTKLYGVEFKVGEW